MMSQKNNKMENILSTLRNELNEMKYEINSRFPSEYILSERFGVNKTTANKAVALLIAEGYLKRGNGGQGTIVVRQTVFPKKHVVFIGAITTPFTALLAHGLQKTALADHSLVSLVAPSPSDLNITLNELKNMKIDGIISTSYGLLPETGFPTIYLEDQLGTVKLPDYVACDSYHSGFNMMQEILKRGHKDIVLVAHIKNNPDRLRGFYDAMEQSGIKDYKQRTFWMVESTIGESKLLLMKIKQRYPNFTTIATCSDNDIYRMIICMQQKKIDWIGRKAMVGFGNLAGISDIYPIATVDQHPIRIGAEAYRLLLQKIADPKTPVHELLDTELVNLQNIPILL